MTLADQRTMFADAENGGYALGSFDVVTLEMAYGVVNAAESLNSPVIVAVADTHNTHFNFDALGQGVVSLARSASVPVGVHFDHGITLGAVAAALRAGFTSVMYDGAGQDWTTHLGEIRVVTEMAHGLGAVVEGALSAHSRSETANPTGEWDFPDDGLIQEFLSETGIDILAIGEGSIDLPSSPVRRIHATTDAYLSLHGGSKLPDATVTELVEAGVRKCSVFGKVTRRAMQTVKEFLETSDDLIELGEAISRGFRAGVAAELVRMGSVNRVSES